ncbi:MAG TPA: DUF4395 family protein [Acidimicrobiales bacterium]|nr:DUF4395 family protein [Acidimicrobiales bacterium]
MSVNELTTLLRDPDSTWTERRTRLQGWRGDDACRADAAAGGQRVGPAACAIGAFAGVALASPVVLGVVAATAVVGAVAPNHPFEMVYNAWASSRGRATLPPNRAAKRLGCAMGVAFLGGAAVAYAVGATTLGLVLALVLGVTATFVAATGVCVPSMLFTVLWGAERGAAPGLLSARRSAAPTAR